MFFFFFFDLLIQITMIETIAQITFKLHSYRQGRRKGGTGSGQGPPSNDKKRKKLR